MIEGLSEEKWRERIRSKENWRGRVRWRENVVKGMIEEGKGNEEGQLWDVRWRGERSCNRVRSRIKVERSGGETGSYRLRNRRGR